ncbi:homocysteine S-methyltransferase family protein [Gymnodinialimonas hymeniacidonis]|uniref:homocysteine S-methyltransferase family protein n=1 Tax=Gymnodinialimonas hymeniacidonis TaxID=3126508 RepID=UPI0034C68A6C
MDQLDHTRPSALLTTSRPYLTDGGLETTLIFHDGLDLPEFAAFPLLETEDGRAMIARYYNGFLKLAAEAVTGFVLDTPTWRASQGWGAKLGLAPDAVAQANGKAAAFAAELAKPWREEGMDVVLNGVIGPEGDGYAPGEMKSVAAYEAYHAHQIAAFAKTQVDMVSAVTMTHVEEAIGIARAAALAGLPVIVSFTVETDGVMPSGQRVADAVAEVDAATGSTPIFYMINCAHPDHYAAILRGEAWTHRLGGLRSNASRMSHAELDEAAELDDGDPQEFGELHAEMLSHVPRMKVLGGCCGTDHRHIAAVGHTCLGGHHHVA